VLFVTLYERFPINAQLLKELHPDHPVFFLFIAASSVASVGWARLCGDFNYVAKIAGGVPQPVPRRPLLAGMVGVHVPDDEHGHHDGCVRVCGDQRTHPGAGRGAIRGGHRHRRWRAGDHHVPRVRAQGPVPQRRVCPSPSRSGPGPSSARSSRTSAPPAMASRTSSLPSPDSRHDGASSVSDDASDPPSQQRAVARAAHHTTPHPSISRQLLSSCLLVCTGFSLTNTSSPWILHPCWCKTANQL
jgi:hypothetical protein